MTMFLIGSLYAVGLSGCRTSIITDTGIEVEIPQPAITVANHTGLISKVFANGDLREGNPAALCNLAPEFCARSPALYPCNQCTPKQELCPPCNVRESAAITTGPYVLCTFIYDRDHKPTLDHEYHPPNFRFPKRFTNTGSNELPIRPEHCPWVLMKHSKVCHNTDNANQGTSCYPSLFRRKDIMWLSVGLGDWHLDQDGVWLGGVTILPPVHVPIRRVPSTRRKYLLSFMGHCKNRGQHNTRGHIRRIFGNNTDPKIRVMCVVPGVNGWAYSNKYKQMFVENMNAYYALIPHGDNRWSYRFAEAIMFGAIPVVVSDGLKLPLGEIIDWTQASVRIYETEWAKFTRVEDVINQLPLKRTAQLQTNVAKIRDAYFSTSMKRNAGILSAINRKLACRSPRV